jgi:low molecular weight phosphotyrosine protein phosphatase
MSEKKGILMICLGNICRSPIAEAVIADQVKKQNLQNKFFIDSAAIGPWHVGKSPDRRALETMRKHDLEYTNKARKITKEDFRKFRYIFGMGKIKILILS